MDRGGDGDIDIDVDGPVDGHGHGRTEGRPGNQDGTIGSIDADRP